MPIFRFTFGGAIVFACFAGAAACSSSSGSDADAGSGGASQVFVAQDADFAGFRSWTSTPGVSAAGAPDPSTATDGGIHAGTLTTYINKIPAHGSTQFPVGTIIVKEESNVPLATRQVFAMVKRGGDFNPTGAVNWEWFGLQNVDENTEAIEWRGAPGSGNSYGTDPNVCNDCHIIDAANDYVWTEGLTLSSF